MCGIWGILGESITDDKIKHIISVQNHRGPDNSDFYQSSSKKATLIHNRLSIIDLSNIGNQPMSDPSSRYTIVFNGEIYNYLEIRKELSSEWDFKSNSDTEVLLAGYVLKGEKILDQLIGMFSFAIWDEIDQTAIIVRDRFGVKPLYYHQKGNSLIFSSEIKGIHAYGIERKPNAKTWSNYLGKGLYDTSVDTFWDGVQKLLPGHLIRWNSVNVEVKQWYNIFDKAKENYDSRDYPEVFEEYDALLKNSLELRFRSDVPVGINISGGLDSSLLLGMINKIQKNDQNVKAFTFTTGDENYDELPWVREMINKTNHQLVDARLKASDVPELAELIQHHQDEPFGGLPTIAYANLFKVARSHGVKVLLDGQGMDEQWAGYDYYRKIDSSKVFIQGIKESPIRSKCLTEEFRNLAVDPEFERPFSDNLRNVQYRDIFYTKIPRALRFNDRVSMAFSTELREPFLDHRLFELAINQRPEYKISKDQGKVFLRKYMESNFPNNITQAPKRPVQTPQREWLRSELKEWASSHIDYACNHNLNWLVKDCVETEWNNFLNKKSDNSFYVWQWISLGMILKSIDNGQ